MQQHADADDKLVRLYMCDLWTVLQLRRTIEDSMSDYDSMHAKTQMDGIVARMQIAWPNFTDAQRADIRARRSRM